MTPFETACLQNQLDVAKKLLKHESNEPNDEHILYRQVCDKGYTKVARWLSEMFPDLNVYDTWHDVFEKTGYNWCAYGRAFKTRNLDLVKLVYSKNPNVHVEYFERFQKFSLNGNAEMATWIYEHYDGIDLHRNNCSLFRWACECENVHAMQIYRDINKHEHISYHVVDELGYITSDIEFTTNLRTKHKKGITKMWWYRDMQYIDRYVYMPRDIYVEDVKRDMCNHFGVVYVEPPIRAGPNICEKIKAAYNENDLAKIHETIHPIDTYDDVKETLWWACSYGVFDIVHMICDKYIVDTSKICICEYDPSYIYHNRHYRCAQDISIFSLACNGGSLDVVKFLVNKYTSFSLDIESNFEAIYRPMVTNRRGISLNIAKWLMMTYPKVYRDATEYQIYDYEYIDGKYVDTPGEVIKQFKEYGLDDAGSYFSFLCEYNTLDLAQYAYNKFPYINIRYQNDEPFRMACAYGYIETVTWLLEICPDIDIHVKDEYAFQLSCANQNMDIANMLLEMAENDDVWYHIDEYTGYIVTERLLKIDDEHAIHDEWSYHSFDDYYVYYCGEYDEQVIMTRIKERFRRKRIKSARK